MTECRQKNEKWNNFLLKIVIKFYDRGVWIHDPVPDPVCFLDPEKVKKQLWIRSSSSWKVGSGSGSLNSEWLYWKQRSTLKMYFFTIHCNPSLAYIAVRDLPSPQRNASEQSLLWYFFGQPIAAECWLGIDGKLSNIILKSTIYNKHPVCSLLR